MRCLPLTVLLLLGACSAPPGPSLRRVEPPEVPAELGGPVALLGEGFLPGGTYDFDRPDASALGTAATASLELDGASAALLEVQWRDVNTIAARVPAGLAPGAWTVRLNTPRGEPLTLAAGLRLTPFVTDAGRLLDGGWPDGGPDAGPRACERFTYLDEDGDGFGAPASGAYVCGAGRIAEAGDCNDLDPLSSPQGVEVCNGLDDDCDGAPDDGRACVDAGLQALGDLAAPGTHLLVASAWSREQLWLGGGQRLFARAAAGTFTDQGAGCPANLTALWVADGGGHAFVAGGGAGVGRLALATLDAGCGPAELLPAPVAGMVGFPAPDAGVRVEGVLEDGRRFTWAGVGPVTIEGAALPQGARLTDAHAVAPGAFFAVGGTLGPPRRPAVFRMGFGGGLVAEELPAGLPDGWLRSVWSISPFEAVAVGDEGLVVRRRFGRWESVLRAAPSGFTAVRAFSVGRFYAVSDGGLVQLWNGQWASRPQQPRAVRDLDGVDEEHLWLVGDDGLVVKGAPLP